MPLQSPLSIRPSTGAPDQQVLGRRSVSPIFVCKRTSTARRGCRISRRVVVEWFGKRRSHGSSSVPLHSMAVLPATVSRCSSVWGVARASRPSTSLAVSYLGCFQDPAISQILDTSPFLLAPSTFTTEVRRRTPPQLRRLSRHSGKVCRTRTKISRRI